MAIFFLMIVAILAVMYAFLGLFVLIVFKKKFEFHLLITFIFGSLFGCFLGEVVAGKMRVGPILFLKNFSDQHNLPIVLTSGFVVGLLSIEFIEIISRYLKRQG